MGGSFGTTALLPLCKHSTSESDSKSKPGVCVPADLTGTYGKGSTHEDTGDTHWLSPIPCTAPPDHSAEPNPIPRFCTPQHCMELWGGNPHAMGLVPVHSQCPPCCWGPRHVRDAEPCAASGPFVPSPDGGSDAALLQPSASQPSPPLPPSPHQGLTLGQMLGWEGCLELEGSCGVGGCARQKTAGKWSPHVANGI